MASKGVECIYHVFASHNVHLIFWTSYHVHHLEGMVPFISSRHGMVSARVRLV
ncbi:hypothetical protein M404DRAFT_993352 [Pisolithus tinctorius Marx 270]|uniref:Uncharacterized protein n=1 Tax=Pisolithus tinctorius Marx 270 TaxID=870435 RepID=A0A0C3PEU4_PISTI|nr:hypothetical protein M404DRAFT_993352 [Pisolithus tinctorius Marx 270]